MTTATSEKSAINSKLLSIFLAWSMLLKSTIKLFSLEFKLAQKSFLMLIICSLLFLVLTLGAWAILVAISVIGLNYFTGSWLLSLCLVAVINVLLILVVLLLIAGYVKNLRFKHTRKHLFHWERNKKHVDSKSEKKNPPA